MRTFADAVIGPSLGQQALASGRVARQVDVIAQRDRLPYFRARSIWPRVSAVLEAGHHVLEAFLVGGHHIGIALHDDRRLLAPDGGLGQVDREQVWLLSNSGPGRRVQVLRTLLAGMIRPPSPTARPDESRIDDHPTAEAVDHPAAVGRTGKAGTDQLLAAEAATPGDRSAPPTCWARTQW